MKIEKGIPIPKNKSRPGTYKAECIQLLYKMNIGDSVLVKDRTRDTVRCWTMFANRKLKRSNSKELFFKIASIEHKQQRIWRIK